MKKEVVALSNDLDDTPMPLIAKSVRLNIEFFENAAPELARRYCPSKAWPELGELIYSLLQRLSRNPRDLDRTLGHVCKLPPPNSDIEQFFLARPLREKLLQDRASTT